MNKRLIKSPKVYFLNTGLSVRLQGWLNHSSLLASPQAGALFETLVLSEIVKFITNFGKNWKIALWRTKDGEEIDFVIENSADPVPLPTVLSKIFPNLKQIILVTFGGKKHWLSKDCLQVPLTELTDFLLEWK